MAKTGETVFACIDLQVAWAEPFFLPLSVLNALRREVLDGLAAARARNRPVWQGDIAKNNVPFPEAQLTYLGNVLNRKAEAFYRRHGVTHIEAAAESGLDMRGRKVMTTRYCIKHQLGWCPREKDAPSLQEPLFLVDEEGRRYELRFKCADCEMEIVFEPYPR
jgi:putative protease